MIKGIYKIVNLKNSKVYIGSTTNFSRRKKEHFKRLKANNHGNPHLQHSYNKYKEESFIFEIIERTEELIIREQYYIKQFNTMNPKVGYNICFPHINGGSKAIRNSHENKKPIYGICQTTNKILIKYKSVQEARDLLHSGIGNYINKDNSYVNKMALVSVCEYDKFKDYRKKYKTPYIKKGKFEGRPVETYNPYTLEVLKVYNNKKELAEELGTSIKYIGKVLRKEKGKGVYKGVGIRWKNLKRKRTKKKTVHSYPNESIDSVGYLLDCIQSEQKTLLRQR